MCHFYLLSHHYQSARQNSTRMIQRSLYSTAKRRKLTPLRADGTRSLSTNSLPLRHSSKPRIPVYINDNGPYSHCQIDSLPLTPKHLEDLENPQYHLLYDLIGSRFYASCPELAIEDEYEDGVRSTPKSSTFYLSKKRSCYRTEPHQSTKRQNTLARIAQTFAASVFPCCRQ